MELELPYIFFFVVLISLLLCFVSRNSKPPRQARHSRNQWVRRLSGYGRHIRSKIQVER